MVNVGGDPSGRSRETITRQIQTAELVSVGQKCDLQLRIPGRASCFFIYLIILFIYYKQTKDPKVTKMSHSKVSA